MTAEVSMSLQNISPSDEWIKDPVSSSIVGLKTRTTGKSMVPLTYTGSPAQAAITALAGGGQTGATQLLNGVNRVDTVATAADSVMLPSTTGTAGGLIAVVVNNTATAMQVFGSGADTINGNAAATGISQAANTLKFYVCTLPGAWNV
jgi:hypothetical protein